MPLSLTENFNNGMPSSLSEINGTWQVLTELDYVRAISPIPDEPEAIAVFEPGDSDYFYNDPTVTDPPVGSYAQFTVAAQGGDTGGVGFWLLSGGTDLGEPAILVTTRPNGIRCRYWNGAALVDAGWPQWTDEVVSHDVVRAEIISNECRVALNGTGIFCFTDARLVRGGWHGLRVAHSSANSGADD